MVASHSWLTSVLTMIRVIRTDLAVSLPIQNTTPCLY